MLTSLLTACSSWFQPKTKTIEYDEEVKLHNGEMIWVHITRHYFLAGEIAHGSGYMPGAVEISWDTGFEGVGRKSVFFDRYVSYFDFKDNKYFIVGSRNKALNKQGKYGDSCGSTYGIMGFAIIYDNKGTCHQPESWQEFPSNPVRNIATFKATVPEEWDGKSLSWEYKVKNPDLFKNFNENNVQKSLTKVME